MKEKFKDGVLYAKTQRLVDQSTEILLEYQAMGLEMTQRQLFYQLVARGLIENDQPTYDKLLRATTRGRDLGLIDWDLIVDRTRTPVSNGHWESPQEVLEHYHEIYERDKWEDQPYYVEVWVEKDALTSVIEPVCRENDVIYFAHRGNNSATAQYDAAGRILAAKANGKIPIIIHLADHDPGGLDMTRDNQERLDLYTYGSVYISRIALNMDQVERYNPPTSFTKQKDPRAAAYIKEFGDNMWELDALPPNVLTQLIQNEIDTYKDRDLWDEAVEREADERSAFPALIHHLPAQRL